MWCPICPTSGPSLKSTSQTLISLKVESPCHVLHPHQSPMQSQSRVYVTNNIYDVNLYIVQYKYFTSPHDLNAFLKNIFNCQQILNYVVSLRKKNFAYGRILSFLTLQWVRDLFFIGPWDVFF